MNASGKKRNLSGSLSRTPKYKKSTIRSPGRFNATPGSKPTTPSRSDGADRFIPSRQAIDFEASRFLLQRGDLVDSNTNNTMSPSKLQFQKQMAENLYGQEVQNFKIISYQKKAPTPRDTHSNGLKVLYSECHSPYARGSTRHFPQAPDRILDAPDIVNDYYLNILDWSSNNHLAVALGPQVYLWNAANGKFFFVYFSSLNNVIYC